MWQQQAPLCEAITRRDFFIHRCLAGIRDPDTKNNPVEITYSVDGLDPQTNYHFQIKASNINDDGDTESEWTHTEGQTLGERDKGW